MWNFGVDHKEIVWSVSWSTPKFFNKWANISDEPNSIYK